MRLSFVLALVATFKLAASIAIRDDSGCPPYCAWNECCPGYYCEAITAGDSDVSMRSFHLTPWLTDVVVVLMYTG
ncbi:hypothetical protein F4604DRAFT_1716832 [Suillus subluteus]|nr:hypothetical protein F4604DRAFT_1716832 [Suillus subluteus]